MLWALCICLFVIVRSIEYLYTKKILANNSPLAFVFLRSLFSLFCMFLLIPFIDLNINYTQLFLVYTVSLFAAFGIYYRTKAIKIFEVSYVIPMLNLIPFFVFIFAVIFLKESLSLTKTLGILLVVFSVYLLHSLPRKNVVHFWSRFLFKERKYIILIPIFLFSFTTIIDKYTLRSLHPFTFVFYLAVFFTLNFFIFVLKAKKLKQVKQNIIDNSKYYFVIGFLLFLSKIGQYTAVSLREVSITTPLLMTSSLIVVITAKKFFNETNILAKILSTITLIAGITLLII